MLAGLPSDFLPKGKGPLICGPVVELPGIEPGAEIGVSCRNAENQHAKRPESTRIDLRIREMC